MLYSWNIIKFYGVTKSDCLTIYKLPNNGIQSPHLVSCHESYMVSCNAIPEPHCSITWASCHIVGIGMELDTLQEFKTNELLYAGEIPHDTKFKYLSSSGNNTHWRNLFPTSRKNFTVFLHNTNIYHANHCMNGKPTTIPTKNLYTIKFIQNHKLLRHAKSAHVHVTSKPKRQWGQTNTQVRGVISFLDAMWNTPTQILQKLIAMYALVMSKKQVSVWCTMFQARWADLNDDLCLWRLPWPHKMAAFVEFTPLSERTHAFKFIKLQQSQTFQQLATEIIHDKLGYRRVSWKGMSKQLPKQHKIMHTSLENLLQYKTKCFQQNYH
jgi:hypothetical protein